MTEATFLQRNSFLRLTCSQLFNDEVRGQKIVRIIVELFELNDLFFVVYPYTSNIDRLLLVKLNHLCRTPKVEEELVINDRLSECLQVAF